MIRYDKSAVQRYRQVWFWLLLWVVFLPYVQAEGIITTVAGSGTIGFDNGGFSGDGEPAINAQLNYPVDIAVDSDGNLYIADKWNHRIRKVDATGIISTIAGNGITNVNGAGGFSGDGGPATSAQLNYPEDMAFDSKGNLYIADTGNHRIRKVDVTGIISTVAGNSFVNDYGGSNGSFSGDGGPATSAKLDHPEGVAIDSDNNLYIADYWNDRIRKVDTAGIISTIAGNGVKGFSGDGGPATSAQLIYPSGVTLDSRNNLYIVDYGNNCIRKVDTDGKISTVAGSDCGWENGKFSGDGGPATSAKFHDPSDVAIDNNGNLYITDIGNQRIRKVDTTGIISTVAGNEKDGFSGDGGVATGAQLDSPNGIAVDSSGNLYIADVLNHRIRKVTFSNATENKSLTANYSASPTSGQAPLTVTLDASSSTGSGDSFGFIVSYQWSVNGQTLTGAVVTVTLENAGDYPITLTVTDYSGATATKTGTITVTQPVATNQPPKADYYASPNSGEVPLTVTLDASPSSDSDGSIVSYQWVVNGQTLSEKTVSVTLENAGDYPVTLTVTDDKGATDTKTDKITVSQPVVANQPPIANYSASPTSGQAPLPVTLDASSSTDADGSIVSYQWLVNEQTLSGPTASVTLEKAGNYSISLTVTDDKGATDTVTYTITVNQPAVTNQPPKADYYASPNSGEVPLTVTLDASPSSDSDGSIVSYQWVVNGKTLSVPTTSVTLEKAGDYPITLTVTDDKGATDTVTYTITVNQPTVTLAPKIRIEPATLTFDNAAGTRRGNRDANDKPIDIHKVPGNQELFIGDSSQIEENSSDPTITRINYAEVKPYALSQPDATFGTVYAEQVTLNLFPDVSFTVNNTSVNYRAENDYTWIGKIEGMQFGDVILVVKDGKVTGNVNAAGYGLYQIRPMEKVYHLIQQINPATFSKDIPSLTPPVESTSSFNNESHLRQGTSECRVPVTDAEETVVIEVMVVYTSRAAQWAAKKANASDINSEEHIKKLVDLVIGETNQAYVNSGINQKLHLAYAGRVDYQESGSYILDINILKNISDGYLDEVHQLRDTYKADLVSLWVEQQEEWKTHKDSDGPTGPDIDYDETGPGRGSQMRSLTKEFADSAFNVLDVAILGQPGNYAFAHELGHNMGAAHDVNAKKSVTNDGVYLYSHGFVHKTGDRSNSWKTIMAYGSECGTDYSNYCPQILYFSNPDILCDYDLINNQTKEMMTSCHGIPVGDSVANNAKTLRCTAKTVASFRESSNLSLEDTKQFTIYNDGDADLDVKEIKLEGDELTHRGMITFSPKSAKVAPNASVTVNVKISYNLAPSGQSTNRLLVFSDDPTSPSLPVNIVVNRQVDATVKTYAPADVYDGDVQSLSVTAQVGEGTYQAILDPITLQPSVVGSTFGISGYVPLESSFVDEQVTTYDPLTGIVRIPIGSTYLPTGEPVLFEVEMKETSPGIFEITNFLIIPVLAIE